MRKTICILGQSFMMRESSTLEDLKSHLSSFPKSLNPVKLVDRKKYFSHVSVENGFMHISQDNIFQIDMPDRFMLNSGESIDTSQCEVYLDSNKQIELRTSSLKWIFILDPLSQFGMILYFLELDIRGGGCLQVLADNNKIFRYIKDPGDQSLRLNLFYSGKQIEAISFYQLFELAANSTCAKIEFLSTKPFQIHLLDKFSFTETADRKSYCYNLLRIPANVDKEIEDRYFQMNDNHVYENSSLFSFAMSEGVVFTSPYKSPKMLLSNYLTPVMLTLFFRERTVFILSQQAKSFTTALNGIITRGQLDRLKKMRRNINIMSFLGSIPLSQYSEIQEIYSLAKFHFLRGADFLEIKSSLNDASSIIEEELTQESIDRQSKIGLLLGVLGITGFISFIFDYLVISKNQRLIDTLDFPLNSLPFILFLLTFAIIWKFLNKK